MIIGVPVCVSLCARAVTEDWDDKDGAALAFPGSVVVRKSGKKAATVSFASVCLEACSTDAAAPAAAVRSQAV